MVKHIPIEYIGGVYRSLYEALPQALASRQICLHLCICNLNGIMERYAQVNDCIFMVLNSVDDSKSFHAVKHTRYGVSFDRLLTSLGKPNYKMRT